MDVDTCMFRHPTNICWGGLCGAKHRSRCWEHSNEEGPGRAQPSGGIQARRWSVTSRVAMPTSGGELIARETGLGGTAHCIPFHTVRGWIRSPKTLTPSNLSVVILFGNRFFTVVIKLK